MIGGNGAVKQRTRRPGLFALEISLYTFLQILSVRPFEKLPLPCAFPDASELQRYLMARSLAACFLRACCQSKKGVLFGCRATRRPSISRIAFRAGTAQSWPDDRILPLGDGARRHQARKAP
jgi:hypothetical protein